MHKMLLLFLSLLVHQYAFSQVGEKHRDKILNRTFDINVENKDSITSFKQNGKSRLGLSQAYFSNWISGGSNTFTIHFNHDHDLSYQNASGLVWNTKILLSLGGSYLAGEKAIRKSDDRFELNSEIGFDNFRGSKWAFSSFFNIRTQLLDGYKYTVVQNEDIKTQETSFFSPGLIQLGMGFFKKKGKRSQTNFSPLTTQVTIIDKELAALVKPGKNYFGVTPGRGNKVYLGMALYGFIRSVIGDNINLDYRYRYYANYLNKFTNIDFAQQLRLEFVVNKLFSCNLELELHYDDDLVKNLQIKELLSLGIRWDV